MEEIKKDYIENINFTDEMTLTTIGCWEDVLRQRNIIGEIENNNVKVIEKDNEEAKRISKIFYRLLQQTKYKFDDRVTITYESAEPENRRLFYNLHLDKQNKDIKLELEVGGGLEYSSYLTIKDGNNKLEFSLINSCNPDIESLELDSYIFNNPDKKLKYQREYAHHFTNVHLFNNNYVIDIHTFFPDRVVKEYFTSINKEKNVIILPEEKDLQHYLCNLTFPVNIDQVFSEIRQHVIINGSALEEYPDFEISIYNADYDLTTDKIVYKNGERTKYINSHLDSDIKHITFADENTLVSLAQWTRVINLWDVQKTLKNPEEVHEVVANELQIKGKDKVEELLYSFLSSTEFNIDDQVTISLVDVKEDDRFFNYKLHLDKQNKDIDIKTITGGGLDFPDEMYISEGNKEFVYNIGSNKDGDPVLNKMQEIYTYDNCKYERDCIGGHIYMRVRQGEYLLYLNFVVKTAYDGKYYRLNHENEVREYLASLTFPVNIDEVFNKVYNIAELNNDYIANYPQLYLSIGKWNENHFDTTDVIEYQNGVRSQYINTSLSAEQIQEQNRLDKVNTAIAHDIDVSLVNEPDTNFWEAVNNENKKRI